VAEAMGVKFLAQGNNSPNWASNLEPCNYRADALVIARASAWARTRVPSAH